MSTFTPETQPEGPPPPRREIQSPGAPYTVRSSVKQWLTDRRNAGDTPTDICKDLVANGWDADNAARTSLLSLRTADRHRLLYITLCWAAGLAALGLGTAAHLALTSNAEPLALAAFITLFLVMAPLAAYSGYQARLTEESEPHAIWSPTRHALFGTLAACVGVVGLARMLIYTFEAVAAAVGAEGYEFTPSSVVQVMVTISIAVPLFWWSIVEWRRSSVAIRSLGREDRPGRSARAAASQDDR